MSDANDPAEGAVPPDVMDEDASRTDHALRAKRRRRRRLWSRFLLIAVVAPVALLALAFGGPPLMIFVIVPVVVVAIGLDWLLGADRRAERREDLRARRRRAMERAIERGGPSTAPAARHESPDPNEAERSLFGRRMSGLISGIWPRGRI